MIKCIVISIYSNTLIIKDTETSAQSSDCSNAAAQSADPQFAQGNPRIVQIRTLRITYLFRCFFNLPPFPPSPRILMNMCETYRMPHYARDLKGIAVDPEMAHELLYSEYIGQ